VLDSARQVRVYCLAMRGTTATRIEFDADRLQRDMVVKGWLPVDLARKAKVSHMTVHRFLRGERQTARTLKKLAHALGHDVDRYLVSASQPMAVNA
jgi:transcriptional regulator with XRE-family HTH domain